MYKEKIENVEIYFICYKKEEMNLIDSYYDEILDIHYWYFNAYLAYKYWKRNFKNIKLGLLEKNILIIAASRYILYKIENKEYKNIKEYNKLKKELKQLDSKIKKLLKNNNLLIDL